MSEWMREWIKIKVYLTPESMFLTTSCILRCKLELLHCLLENILIRDLRLWPVQFRGGIEGWIIIIIINIMEAEIEGIDQVVKNKFAIKK